MRRILNLVPQVASDLNRETSRWLRAWIAVGALATGVAASFDPLFGVIAAAVTLLSPPVWLAAASLWISVGYSLQDGLVLLLDETIRVFRADATVVETWTREIRNASSSTVHQSFDIPMFWDKPLREPYLVALYWTTSDRTGRLNSLTKVVSISEELPEYSERLFEGRRFYGSVLSQPIELEAGSTGTLRLTYDGDIRLPADDQIIRARGKVLRLRWIGLATDGLVFDASECHVEAKEADPTGMQHRKETRRARRYMRLENDGTRLEFDMPRPRPGFHYRVCFAFRQSPSVEGIHHVV